MTPDDAINIAHAIRSYRVGAPISVLDVRIALKADGHRYDYAGNTIVSVLSRLCVPIGKDLFDRTLWRRTR